MRRFLFLALAFAAVLASTIGPSRFQGMTSSDAIAQPDGLRATSIGLVTADHRQPRRPDRWTVCSTS